MVGAPHPRAIFQLSSAFSLVALIATGCGRIGYDATAAADGSPRDALPGPGRCSGGDLAIEDPDSGTCYVFVTAMVPWSEARDGCTSLGGDAHLIAVSHDLEQQLIATVLLAPLLSVDVIWLGGTDAGQEGSWTWITAEPFSYTNWNPGEPNNAGPDGQNCLGVVKSDGGEWDDRNCANPYSYGCEQPQP